MIRLPEEYLKQMQELLQDEYADYLACFDRPYTSSFRLNTSRISVKDFQNISPFAIEAIPWTTDGFYYYGDIKPALHPYFHAGLYYLQEASAMLPAEVLPISEGDYVLDACAAPGGKAGKLANRLNHTGVLVANDLSVSRAQVLLSTLERQGVSNAYVMAEDILKLEGFNDTFDKILVDAPCSGEGMFHKDKELIKSWSSNVSDEYSARQKQILAKAIRMLKPGGMLVYSTCTFAIKEDEEVVEYALDQQEDLRLLPIRMYPGFSKGLTARTENCVRLYPHKLQGEGHFVALFQKQGSSPANRIPETRVDYPAFLKEISLPYQGKISERKGRLYLEPDHDLQLDGLRILRSGLFLGEYEHERFQPSQALAMALKAADYPRIIDLAEDDIRVNKYLKCETLNLPDFDIEGTVLVCVDHFPLGFGKIRNHILKNCYPPNYRIK